MNNVHKLNLSQVQKQLEDYNSSITIERIIKVSQFLNDFNLHVNEVIGFGTFSVVLKGFDNQNSREIAVKIITNQNYQKLKELEEEIMNLRNFQSEYVIKIYECFYDQNSCCFIIIMEYCQHGDLYDFFKNKKSLEKEEIINLLTNILIGLQDIHSKGIMHSNLKPQNILLAENYKPKICDFGLYNILQNNQSYTAYNGETSIYSSNEQMCGQVRLESDYYSAGAVLCFLSGLEIDNLILASQLKNGLFPDINYKRQKQIIEIGFQMMQLDPLKRINLEIASEKLINLKNQQKIRSQTESDKDKQIKNDVWIYFYNNGDKYEGEWRNDKMNGQGVYYWQNGDRYEGEFKNDMKCGLGTLIWKNGDKYVGQYQNDKRNGYGIKYFLSGQFEGDRYEGEYKDNVFHGLGTYYWKCGSKYIGRWQNDKMNGNGVFYFIIGNIYEGEFKDNQRNGQGTLYFKNGNKFVGQYLNSKKNGLGIHYWQNGHRYEGEFKNDIRSGQGTFYWQNGDKYVGQYSNDKRNGYGIKYFLSGQFEGDRYEGEYKDDAFHGQGTYYWKSGEKYIGEWQNDRINGKGVSYFISGNRYEGEYINSKLNGQGIFYYKNGSKLVGQFLNNMKNGQFIYYYQDGKSEVQFYVNDVKQ